MSRFFMGGRSRLRPTWQYDFKIGAAPPGSVFTRASTGWYFDSTGTLVSAATNIPRFAYDPVSLLPLGFLAESPATNTIRNNTAVGAVAGTPGTLPTNWSTNVPVGLAVSVVGSGTINGITYVDIRYSGTSGSAGGDNQYMDTTTGIAASPGSVWALSAYLQIVAGAFPASGTMKLGFVQRIAGGGGVSSGANVDSVITTPNGVLTRYSATLTAASSEVVFVEPKFLFTYNSGIAVDFTLRVGLPQLELSGSGPTSPIRTTGTAATRSQDILTLPLTSVPGWDGSRGGVIVAAYRLNQVSVPSNTQSPVRISDNSFANYVMIRANDQGLGNIQVTVVSNSVSQGGITGAGRTPALGVRDKIAIRWDIAGNALCQNGTLVNSFNNSSLALPVALSQMEFGRFSSTSLNGTLESVAYYAGARADAFVQAVSR